MYRKDITYTNFNGQETTRPFYFNITKAELALRELESDGTWSESMKAIAASNKGSVVLPEFKKLVKWTYGEKSADGESFEKSDEIWAKFENSEPWSALMMELLTDAQMAANFFNNCMPPDMVKARLEAEAQPGFRPGADTGRPTAPGSNQPADSSAPAPAINAPAEPIPAQQVYTPPAQPQEPVIQYRENLPENGGSTTIIDPNAGQAPVDQNVERLSTPRHSDYDGPQQ